MATVTELKSKQPKCPYCALVPADQHPEFSCPRISSIELSDPIVVGFVAPDEWAVFLKECGVASP